MLLPALFTPVNAHWFFSEDSSSDAHLGISCGCIDLDYSCAIKLLCIFFIFPYVSMCLSQEHSSVCLFCAKADKTDTNLLQTIPFLMMQGSLWCTMQSYLEIFLPVLYVDTQVLTQIVSSSLPTRCHCHLFHTRDYKQ